MEPDLPRASTHNVSVPNSGWVMRGVGIMSAERVQRLMDHLPNLEGHGILVVGDVGLDHYVLGDVRRISPEAPVAILDMAEERSGLGLAANVAQNVVSLGGQAIMVGVVGEDSVAESLRGKLKESGISPEGLIVDSRRPTVRKMRLMSGQHHLLRVDFERRHFISEDLQEQVLVQVSKALPQVKVVILGDYAKGLLSESLIQRVIQQAQKAGRPVYVDPYRSTPCRFYRGADILKPNRDEALALLGRDERTEWTDENLESLGSQLRKAAQVQSVVVTRGAQGMVLFSEGEVVRFPTYARKVFDVTGAGDTVIAALALGVASGLSLEDSCVLSNFAAGVVVGQVGTVSCGVDELREYMAHVEL